MTDREHIRDALDAKLAASDRSISLLRREQQGRKLRDAVDMGIIDADTAVALLDFWTPEP